MSRDASVTLDWGDGTYRFRLGQGELIQLQEAADAGPMWILNRMMRPTVENKGWRVEDVSGVIRLGLIGGGMEATRALKLARFYVEERPPMENLIFAQAILSAAILGVPEDEKKSDAAAEPGSTTDLEGNGDGPRSLDSAPSSA